MHSVERSPFSSRNMQLFIQVWTLISHVLAVDILFKSFTRARAELTVFAQEDADYIVVKVEGPSRPTTTRSTSSRNSTVSNWRLALGAEPTVLAQEDADYIVVRVEGPFKSGHFCYSVVRFSRESCQTQRVLLAFSRTLHGSSSSSAARLQQAPSIAKNCFQIELELPTTFRQYRRARYFIIAKRDVPQCARARKSQLTASV